MTRGLSAMTKQKLPSVAEKIKNSICKGVIDVLKNAVKTIHDNKEFSRRNKPPRVSETNIF